MPFLVSKEKRGFIHGRHIHDCIRLASEAVKLLDSKDWCGNIALKVDIAKAFDTLRWDFFLKVLHNFGSTDKFCVWIHNLLQSAHMSVNVNGDLHGYFTYYAKESGELDNYGKSFIYGGGMSSFRLNILTKFAGLRKGYAPFIYLGVPIFKGKPKTIDLRAIADKGMLVHCMVLYDWMISLIRDIVRVVKRFIWSGETTKNKVITVSWKDLCSPIPEGGLGIRSLIKVNETFNLKLAWDFLTSTEPWAVLLRERVLRKGSYIKHHISFSLWSSLKHDLATIVDNSSWNLGNVEAISLWFDRWCGEPLHLEVVDPSCLVDQTISSIISNGRWDFDKAISPILLALCTRILACRILITPRSDYRIWTCFQHGILTSKISFDFKRSVGSCKEWAQWIWSKLILPFKSCLFGSSFTIKWQHMINGREGLSPLCRVVVCVRMRKSLPLKFFQLIFGTGQCKTVAVASFIMVLNAIWLARNMLRFHNVTFLVSKTISAIMELVALVGGCSSVGNPLNMKDFEILKSFKVNIRPPKVPNNIEVIWKSPLRDWVKINCDGAFTSFSNSSCVGIARNHDGNFLGAFASSLEIANSLMAELTSAMMAIELAYEKNWSNLWLETDSTTIIKAFNMPFLVPCTIRNRWLDSINTVSNWNFVVSHVVREGNSCADIFDNIGLNLNGSTFYSFVHNCLRDDFVRNMHEMHFFRFVGS
ncbi:uncharacterized protein LOC131619414 [Vicia villosa]|uniref:uncharacterized protein LOC131619414 n=1 Tax=Vicia villosa TaxID=3911 RepID=UPI00273B81E7|nr:uncharacterized protein LOC131619414 [Vicia villosa]